MSRILTDGGELGDVLLFSTATNVTNSTTAPRSGSRHYTTTSGANSTGTITLPGGALSEMYIRWPVRFTSAPTTPRFFFWSNGSTEMGSIRRNLSSGLLEIYTSVSTLQATGAIPLSIATWYNLEIHIKIDDSVGVIELRVDGVADATYTGDTKPSTETTVDNVSLYSSGTYAAYLDDIAINDIAGSADNSWCGDGKISLLSPSAAGDVTGLTPSTGSNYQCVDEIPASGTDYVYSATADLYDLYNCGTIALGAGELVRRVQVQARMLEESADGDSIDLGVKTVSVESFDSGHAVITSAARYAGDDLTLNPTTGAAWTQTQLDALQVGARIG